VKITTVFVCECLFFVLFIYSPDSWKYFIRSTKFCAILVTLKWCMILKEVTWFWKR